MLGILSGFGETERPNEKSISFFNNFETKYFSFLVKNMTKMFRKLSESFFFSEI